MLMQITLSIILKGPIYNNPALDRIMGSNWWAGKKQSSEPMLTTIYVTI